MGDLVVLHMRDLVQLNIVLVNLMDLVELCEESGTNKYEGSCATIHEGSGATKCEGCGSFKSGRSDITKPVGFLFL